MKPEYSHDDTDSKRNRKLYGLDHFERLGAASFLATYSVLARFGLLGALLAQRRPCSAELSKLLLTGITC